MRFADRIERIQPSMTMAMKDKATTLRNQGVDVVDLGAGEPDFDTPKHIREAAKRALDAGHTRYTKNVGIDPLREAICDKLKRDNGLQYSPNQVIVSNGAKHVLFNTMMSILGPGDEIIIFSPYWVSFPEMAKLTGANPVIVTPEESNNFEPEIEQVREAMTEKTRAILVNSPTNPSGMVYSEETVRGLTDLCLVNDLYLISDECYERITFGREAVSPAKYEESAELIITVQSMSKTYAMTGWRVGYAAGNETLIKNMATIQSQSSSHANSIAQYAALEGLTGEQSFLEEFRSQYLERRDYIIGRIENIPNMTCVKPEGAFYVFPNIGGYFGKSYNDNTVNSSLDMANFLLDEAHVAVVPGGAFGADENVRISYATSLEELERGLDRIEAALEKLN
ncbi:MAG: pyridoxal phosphate-dependent aminotransferase [Candidatus Marinimicrobia bacterium]|nr:pyridoxal phosphate-dependent aminotransferase [Candidatus Neomarinimicrobiota bacterium]MCF7828846.1 pyridoxal phosphate-dependent aminotransferase [Candidatus Neomarinimicrobiota bacterium]MCF7880763.1 pyridoxal phosphate-dependent aminotransferase [Candidatus Neomarinimicrobiota bacterium]